MDITIEALLSYLDLNEIILRKDKAASVKYHHEIDLDAFLLNRQS